MDEQELLLILSVYCLKIHDVICRPWRQNNNVEIVPMDFSLVKDLWTQPHIAINPFWSQILTRSVTSCSTIPFSISGSYIYRLLYLFSTNMALKFLHFHDNLLYFDSNSDVTPNMRRCHILSLSFPAQTYGRLLIEIFRFGFHIFIAECA